MADRTVSVDFVARVAGFTSGVQKMRTEVRTMSGEVSRAAKNNAAEMQTVGIAATAMGVGILGGLGASAKAAMDFESSFAGIRKTVDASEAEFAALSEGFRGLAREIPISVNELNGIGESAGQLGIAKENILSFSATMADLGVATNLTGEEAATAFARLANITQMPQENFDRLGSTVVALGNNLATTEAEISEFGLRIAGAGAQIGLTEAEILGLGGALSSVGINAEAGGTAISKVMIDMAKAVSEGGEQLGLFAEVAGMSADAFAMSFRDDPAAALAAFVEGLGQVDAAGGDLFATLEELGIKEQRMRDAMLRTAGAGTLVADSFRLANGAWEENTALTDEAAQRYATLESRLTLAKNAIYDAGISLGQTLTPALGGAADAVAGLAGGLADLPGPAQLAVAGVGGLAGVTSLAAGGFLLAAPRIMATKVALDTLSATMPRTVGGLRRVTSLLTGPWGRALGVAALGVGIFAEEKGKARARVEELTEAIIADSGALGENTRAHVANRLETEGLLEAAAELGLNLATVTDAAMGNSGAMHEVNSAITSNITGYAELTGASGEAGDAQREAGIAAAELRDGLGELAPEMDTATAAARRIAEATAADTNRYLDLAHAIDSGLDPSLANLAINHQMAADAAAAGTGPVDEFGNATEGAAGQVDSLTGSMWESEEAAEEARKKWTDLANEFLGANQAMDRANEENRGSAEAAAAAHNDAIDSQIAKLKDGETEQRESLEAQKRTWEDYAKDFPATMAQVTSHLEDVNQEFRDWRGDLEEISVRAGGGVAERLAMMGPEWAPIVAEAVDSTAAELAALDQAMVDNISLQMAAAELAVQMKVMEEVALQGSEATVESVATALGAAESVVRGVFDAIEPPNITVDADIDPALAEFAEAHGVSDELNSLIAIATVDANNDPAHRAMMEADGLGKIWDESDFQSVVDADIAQTVSEFLKANGLADAWGNRVTSSQAKASLDWQSIRAVDAELDRLARSRTVRLDLSVRGAASDVRLYNLRQNHAGGWAGTGPAHQGPLKGDEIPAVLQTGEYVLSRDMLAGRVPVFHTGGGVGGYDIPSLFAMTRGPSGGSAGSHLASIEAMKDAYAEMDRILDDIEQSKRRQALLDREAEASAEVRAAEDKEARDRARESLDDAREALVDFDRDASLAADRAAIEARIEIATANQRLTANREEWEFGRMSAADQIRWLDTQIAAHRRYTDEWMRLSAQRVRIIESEASDRAKALEEAADAAVRAFDDELAALNRMLSDRTKILGQLKDAERSHLRASADEHARYAEAVASAQQAASKAVADAINARRDQLASSMPLDTGFSSVAGVQARIDHQLGQLTGWQDALAEARQRGVSSDTISELGLDVGPEALSRLRVLLRAEDDELASLNESVATRMSTITQTVQREQADANSVLGGTIRGIHAELASDLIDLQTEHQEKLADMAAEFAAEQEQLGEELAAIGQDNGLNYSEAIAAGIASGIPAIEAQVARVKALMRQMAAAEAAAADTVSAKRAGLGLVADAESDRIWEDRLAAGTADMGEVERRLRQKATGNGATARPTLGSGVRPRERSYDVGGILEPGLTLAYNGTGRDEYVYTGAQMAHVAPSGGASTGNHYHLTVNAREVDKVNVAHEFERMALLYG